ncbi:MAG: copper resistance system multicopper oxidase [Pseudomonadota bacterium]
MSRDNQPLKPSRRRFLTQASTLGAGFGLQSVLPAWARSGEANSMIGLQPMSGTEFDLTVGMAKTAIDGRVGRSILVNGQLPAPLLRWREGDEITLRVHNNLHVDTSIHWHGILLPFQMDGVPGVTFPGIRPRETFTYRFPLMQAGTYWYHSHSGLQEQAGHYGPIVIEPKDADPVAYDREYVILLSDWTFEDPHRVFAKLKKMSDNYNYQQRTVSDFFDDVRSDGWDRTVDDRAMWGQMRMNPTDIADVTGATYIYLINGHGPRDNWTGMFVPGERVRLRIINASAMSIFDVRIPGLPMTVVQADGLNVQPVETDEFQIGTAETFDVVVQPTKHQAYSFIAESNDRSGLARATLTPEMGLSVAVPKRRARPTLTMKDMAMKHDMDSMDHGAMDHGGMDHGAMGHHGAMKHGAGPAEECIDEQDPANDFPSGPGIVGRAMCPTNRLSERPLGLQHVDHRVLVYTDLKALERNPDTRPPGRELELHLTSNMERYMWSFDGLKFSEVDEPIVFHKDERLRLTLVNNTMMPHPIHLHGMFFDLVTGDHNHKPRKHTVVAKPGEKLSVDITAEAVGDWAFHCHLLYHMHAGMMRIVSVVDSEAMT